MEDNIVAGVDVGAGTAKAVIFGRGQILSYSVAPTSYNPSAVAEKVTKQSLRKVRASFDDLSYVVATGYGRDIVPFANKAVTEIMCHARGAKFLDSGAKTVIDIGCQDSKVIIMDDKGNIINFAMNDKCAAGTGRFIEVMAHALRLKLDEVGPMALSSQNPCHISSTCTVFAESEVVALRGQGKLREDLIAGVVRAIAKRVSILTAGIKPADRVVFSGGVAKNLGVKSALEDELGISIFVPDEPQIVGALGAALIAIGFAAEQTLR